MNVDDPFWMWAFAAFPDSAGTIVGTVTESGAPREMPMLSETNLRGHVEVIQNTARPIAAAG